MNGILYAADATTAANGGLMGGSMGMVIPLVLMVVVFFALVIWPQKKREKEHRNMLAALKQGDRVLTASGMYGVVDSFKENDIVVLKISGNTKVEFTKNSIQVKLP